jgi:lysophospholipase L1-like esterase
MSIPSRLLSALLVLSCLAAAEPAEWKYEKTVAAFEAQDQDAAKRPQPGTIAAIGSSTFTMWKSMPADLAPLPVWNRAFGGSRTGEVLRALPRIILPNKPKVIVYYCGDNDLSDAEKADPAVPVKGFQDFVAAARAELPQVRLVYVSVKPSPKRAASWPKAQQTNAQVQAFCAKDPLLTFVDISKAILDEQGKPQEQLFIKDQLHLNPDGYQRITALIKPAVEAAWQAANKN